MQTVNLKKYYYPLIREDVFVDVSDEVAECLLQLHREEERIRRKIRYHKAYYSLDNNDGIERSALDALLPSPEDILLEQEERRLEQLKLQRMKQAIAGLPVKQANRLQMRYLNSMTYKALAEAEGISHGAIFHSVQDAMRNIRLQFQKNHWLEDL